MLNQLLHYFPPYTYPLILVSDPDAVLVDPQIRAALENRDFRIIQESDPIALRWQVEQARPWSTTTPLIIVTAEPVNTLPYDLWQQGHHVELALHHLFPNLAYSIVQTLTPSQRQRLAEAQADEDRPQQLLSNRETADYLLQAVFGWNPGPAPQPAGLIEWLDDYHARNDPLPPLLAQSLLSKWQRVARLQAWPLTELLADVDFYRDWVRQAWTTYIQVKEGTASYEIHAPLRFDTNKGLQSLLPRLIGSGTLKAVPIPATVELPGWTLPAIIKNVAELRAHHFATLLREVTQRLERGSLGWKEWQALAHQWAQLNLWRYAQDPPLPPDQLQPFVALQAQVDPLFRDWLKAHYANLSSRKLPYPHHLYHVPGWLHYQQEQHTVRPALLVLDGLALADWLEVRRVWQARHPTWQWAEGLILAQIPTITAISRQALISGQLPREFAATLDHNRQETQAWRDFWQSHHLPPDAIAYEHLPTTQGPYPDAVSSRRIQALCLVSTVIDGMVHGSTQGAAEVQAALGIWLGQGDAHTSGSAWLEGLIQHLLDMGYTVTLTSDHGHVEATGIGQPQEGVVAISRGKRARLYRSGAVAHNVQSHFPATMVWHADKLLPEDLWVLMPDGRGAFAPQGELVVSHGGLTLEEMIVPLVTLTKG